MYTCKVCSKEFDKSQSLASHTFAVHGKNKDEWKRKIKELARNKKKSYDKTCPLCGKTFQVFRVSGYKQKSEKKFCSRRCANARIHSIETKDKIKHALQSKYPQKAIGCLRCGSTIRKNNQSGHCQNCFWNSPLGTINKKKLRESASRNKSGGFRERSVNNWISGYYREFWCCSSWELAYLLWCEDKNETVTRNTEGFPYIYQGKNHLFYPDFILEDSTYVEIKGYMGDQNIAKIIQFPMPLRVIGKEEIKPYLEFARGKLGKDFYKILSKEKTER